METTAPVTAVIIATSRLREMKFLDDNYPASMAPTMDRPFIQHVVEFLVNSGIRSIHVLLSHFPEAVEGLLGDGKRWGVSVRYHLSKEAARPYRLLGIIRDELGSGPVLLVHSDRLILADITGSRPVGGEDGVTLFCTEEKGNKGQTVTPVWSGWAWVGSTVYGEISAEADEKDLFAYLMSLPGEKKRFVTVPEPLSVRTCKDLLETHQRLLAKERTDLLMGGREVEEGVWLSRNVRIDPGARLKAPLYIGENCSIGKGVQIGPDTVVGAGCVMGEKSVISSSIIFPGSYVGEGLEIVESIVDRNMLVNVRFGSEVAISEDFILGSLSDRKIRMTLNRMISRIAAGVLILLFSPLFASAVFFSRWKSRNMFGVKTVVMIPALPNRALWKTFDLFSFAGNRVSSGKSAVPEAPGFRGFFLNFLPGLINVVRGELRFVGVMPRTAEEIDRLPEEWKAIYLKSKPGLVTEAMIRFGRAITDDELYSAEAVYTVSAGFLYDLRLLAKYFGRIFGLVPPPDS